MKSLKRLILELSLTPLSITIGLMPELKDKHMPILITWLTISLKAECVRLIWCLLIMMKTLNNLLLFGLFCFICCVSFYFFLLYLFPLAKYMMFLVIKSIKFLLFLKWLYAFVFLSTCLIFFPFMIKENGGK